MLPVKTDGCIFCIRITPQVRNSGKSKYFLLNKTMKCTEDERHQKGPWLTELYMVLTDSTCLEGSKRLETSKNR